MKSRTTFIWFLIAAVLAGFIWFSGRYLQHGPVAATDLLPGLRTADVTSLQIAPAGAHGINVIRTNDVWMLTAPIAYPAQASAIETLLSALEKVMPAATITSGEMASHKNADAEFGFDDPQFTIDIAAGEQSWHLKVGNKTAPGDGVYVRIVGASGAVITDPGWIQFLPHNDNAWRDTSLLGADSAIDWIVLTNGTKSIELRSNPTNHTWRIVRPLDARADGTRINEALQQLRSATVTKFVTDDPKADLTTYGLQPSTLDIWLGQGTNYLTGVHVGKQSPDDAAGVFAQRQGYGSVVTTAGTAFAPWLGTVNDWRERRLVDLSAGIAEIDVTGDNGYVLRNERSATNWAVVGQKYPADLGTIQNFVRLLVNLKVTDFVKDTATPTDLESFGLVTNTHQIILRGVAADTNSTLDQLIFGATQTNRIFVKRGDEPFVYAVSLDDYNQLPQFGWEFRDHRIWNFSETNVSQITLHQMGKTLRILRLGVNQWTPSADSQGIINPLGVEETMHRLGDMVCEGWLANHMNNPEDYGITTNSLQIDVELKSGEKYSMQFGGAIPQQQTMAAATTIDGDRWAFVFPPATLALVGQFLTIPNTPQ